MKLAEQSSKWTKIVTATTVTAKLAVVNALLLCEQHDHTFAVVPRGVVCSVDDINCLTLQGMRLD